MPDPDPQEGQDEAGTAGPLGDIVRALGPRLNGAHVAVTGLGVGTVACYARPGQSWTFYDIDPQVVAIARNPKKGTSAIVARTAPSGVSAS